MLPNRNGASTANRWSHRGQPELLTDSSRSLRSLRSAKPCAFPSNIGDEHPWRARRSAEAAHLPKNVGSRKDRAGYDITSDTSHTAAHHRIDRARTRRPADSAASATCNPLPFEVAGGERGQSPPAGRGCEVGAALTKWSRWCAGDCSRRPLGSARCSGFMRGSGRLAEHAVPHPKCTVMCMVHEALGRGKDSQDLAFLSCS